MPSVCIFDPGLKDRSLKPSDNLGDVIIQQAVTRVVGALFPGHEIVRIATHDYPSNAELNRALACDWMVIGGSNIVGSYAYLYREWKLGFGQIMRLRGRAILFGGGWGWYQERPTIPARWMLNTLLSRTHLHSVRDSYTERHLRQLGFNNVINTSCPTTWPLVDRPTIGVRSVPSKDALLMLTDYRGEPEADRALVQLLLSRYERVHFWLQGARDDAYARALLGGDFARLNVIPHSYAALEAFLKSDVEFDYVGTRLHGGIRCLLAGRRGLIITVDNRAIEMARDIGLPTAPRGDLDAVTRWIDGSPLVELRLPLGNMRIWAAQFDKALQAVAD
jgi:polysaccharide pyruvyl transferase WcaK-like protein